MDMIREVHKPHHRGDFDHFTFGEMLPQLGYQFITIKADYIYQDLNVALPIQRFQELTQLGEGGHD